jgi:hypothetical protein
LTDGGWLRLEFRLGGVADPPRKTPTASKLCQGALMDARRTFSTSVVVLISEVFMSTVHADTFSFDTDTKRAPRK